MFRIGIYKVMKFLNLEFLLFGAFSCMVCFFLCMSFLYSVVLCPLRSKEIPLGYILRRRISFIQIYRADPQEDDKTRENQKDKRAEDPVPISGTG